jgi:penicillin-binding protein 1B
VRYLALATGVFTLVFLAGFFYFFFSYADVIEERLHGERERTLPRVYGRAVDLRKGQMLSVEDLVSRLNDLGYAQRQQIDAHGQFSVVRNSVTISPREGPLANRSVRIDFPVPRPVKTARGAPPPPAPRGIQQIEIRGRGNVQSVELDPPLLTALMADGAREKRRHVPLSTIPLRMRQAVMAIEDQRFYSHSGVSPVRLVAAAFRNATNKGSSVGYSTITQQLARMFFLADEFNAELQTGERGRTWGSYWRKVREIMMSLALERRASKDEILEMYLNDVYLGQRGSFAIHGVAEASRIFFGKDVANVSNSEAATIAGTIKFPGLPFANPKRATDRRNTVLQAMASEEFITQDTATRASREPLQIVARAVDNESPYFVDMVVQQVEAAYPGVMLRPDEISIFTTLDLNLQRAALEAVRNGLTRVDEQLSKRKRKTPPGTAQAALIAVDPRTGEILALVGGRSYNTSQYNRVTTARRQPGSVFKPFVYLAAFERAAEEGRTDLTPASITRDEPGIFEYDGMVWEPKNYDDYDGEVTWRRALAMSRNLGTIRVGELVGFDQVAKVWRRVGVGTPPIAVPSITLGVFELTPFEVAQAYTLFTNGGTVRPLKGLNYIQAGARVLRPKPAQGISVARPDTTFLVTNMLRSVINEGTGAAARAMGFTPDAAGKSGTTNDQRDAWFVGFTPELLTVVWVGFDDNTPIGLTGSQVALPIWTEFMKVAVAGRAGSQFEPPPGISFVEIDRDTGKLATPNCPRTFTESFITGTEPLELCPLHSRTDP